MRQKTTQRIVTAAGSLLLLLAFAGLTLAQQERRVVRPKGTEAILVNPGMGWVFHHYDNSLRSYGSRLGPWDTVDDFPGVGVIYLRLAWSYVEPEEGKFDWSVVDIPAQRWIAKGKQIAFRFSCDEDPGQQGAVPEWVRKAGARIYYSRRDDRGFTSLAEPEKASRWAPDFDDPIFLEKLDHFLAAAAARYDGDPNVAFIDVGSLGIWGEGDPRELAYSAATVRRHIDLHTKNFKRTLLVINDNANYQGRGGEKTLLYARDHGLAVRDDSVRVWGLEDAYFCQDFAGHFWPTLPVILESQHYGEAQRGGHWRGGTAYYDSVEDCHASYVSVHWWPREFLKENAQLVERISCRMGYRLQLVEASWPTQIPAGGALDISSRWRNAGVAPCLPGGHACFTLKGEKGGVAGVFVDESFDMRSLPVGKPGQAEVADRQAAFRLPPALILKPGKYDVYVSVGSRIGTPRIALPLPDDDGQRRYLLGSLNVVAATQTPAGKGK